MKTEKSLLILILVQLLCTIPITANCDYLVKTKKGFKFNCGKVYYSKVQVKDINKRLFKEKIMPLKLADRKVYIKFNHYKTLSITQKLNRDVLDKLAGGDW